MFQASCFSGFGLQVIRSREGFRPIFRSAGSGSASSKAVRCALRRGRALWRIPGSNGKGYACFGPTGLAASCLVAELVGP